MSRLFEINGRKFCFIHVYKTGGTSLRSIIPPGVEIYGAHSAYSDIFDCLPECRTFSVVRNPYTWHYSHFRYIQSSRPHEHHNIVINLNFEQFLEYFVDDLMNRPWRFRNSNYTTQFRMVRGVDKIFKLEDLSLDLTPLTTFLGTQATVLPRKNVGKDKSPQISDHAKQLINKHFQVDFEYLGYEPE